MTNIQKIIEEFDKKFYEAERNAVFCKEHNIFATPYEIKQFLLSSLNQIRQETLREAEEEIKKRKPIEEDKKEISNLEHDKMYHRGWIHCLDYISDIIQSKKENICPHQKK